MLENRRAREREKGDREERRKGLRSVAVQTEGAQETGGQGDQGNQQKEKIQGVRRKDR